MSTASRTHLTVVGAGLAGALLALLAARRGLSVTLYERRPDPRQSAPERGRSINLALAARGLAALGAAGVLEQARPLLIPMRGRMVHEPGGHTALHRYGQRPEEVIWSVGRAALNRTLIDAASRHHGVEVRFDHPCRGVDLGAGTVLLEDLKKNATLEVPLAATVAADGAGSVVRASLARAGRVTVREDWLDHDYKELNIPPGAAAGLEREALHVWPRGGFMLIALPNTDGSFTATLFLPRHGPVSFAALDSPAAVTAFFAREFADAVAHLPALPEQFAAHPQGQLCTVHCSPWHDGGRVLLLGDAAHAIVPFHGQGMNAAFEDCTAFAALLDGAPDWPAHFAAFEQARRENTTAIARMALENYVEMRDTVLDAGFVRRRALALELERRFPGRFIPRYSMVMFHPEIPYAEALRRGAVQEALLRELDRDGAGPSDAAQAARLVEERLPPLIPPAAS